MDIYGEVQKLHNTNSLAQKVDIHIVTRGDLLSSTPKDVKLTFMIKAFNPSGEGVIITENTEFELGV
jgi:hypothetical protein